MKKYVKPTLFYESFELTQFVAGNCGFTVGHSDANCINRDFGGDDMADFILNNPGAFDDYCWTNGSDGMKQLIAS